jgi:UDP-GlcNAc:undecaprenyl-phosphate GlcNAc-1-phosphate transferase
VNAWGDLPAAIRYPLAFVIPALATLFLTPVASAAAHRFGVLDRPGGHKTHREATPYLGGLAVAAGLLVVAAVASGANGQLLTVLVGGVLLAAVGLADDVRGLGALTRVGFELVAGLALWMAGVRANVMHAVWVDLPLTVFWVVAVTNAVNIIDNMDGLAVSAVAASSLGIATIAAINGDYLVASFALAVAGASLGFLRYNFPPASIFLGDAGSMLLGFLVAALILKLDLPVGAAAPRVLSTVLLAGVPLFDLTLVMVARLREGRAVYLGGTDHLSHRLAAAGVSKRAIVLIVAAAQALCSILALVAYRQSQGVVLALGTGVGVIWIGALMLLLRMPAPADLPSSSS